MNKPCAYHGEMIRVLTDATSQLEHYANERPRNWDGSTRTQALATIAEARQLIAGQEADKPQPVLVLNLLEQDTGFLLDLASALAKDFDALCEPQGPSLSLSARDYYVAVGEAAQRFALVEQELIRRKIEPENIPTPSGVSTGGAL